jgi:long-chain acyl-CoA synthetase
MSLQDPAHVIPAETARTLDGLFRERVKRTPDLVACRHYNDQHGNWREYTWRHLAHQVRRWQTALANDGLQAGDRVAVMLRNSPEWVIFDQAALGMGLVVVPLYTQDRPDNVAYIIQDAGCKVLLFEGTEQWHSLREVRDELAGLKRMLAVNPGVDDPVEPRLQSIGEWLPDEGGDPENVPTDKNALATIVYTSGTTGRPKGVMLSHHNILSNVGACLAVLTPRLDDVFLSFLPLSHTFERTCGYYLAVMTGATTAYARSIPQLGEDLQSIRPTLLISVPRIYERVYGTIRARLAEGPAFRKKLFELAIDVGYARFEHAQQRGPWLPSPTRAASDEGGMRCPRPPLAPCSRVPCRWWWWPSPPGPARPHPSRRCRWARPPPAPRPSPSPARWPSATTPPGRSLSGRTRPPTRPCRRRGSTSRR